MERKDKIKKLNNLKNSILAISIASTALLSISSCSDSNEPYYDETLSLEDYFSSHDEDNCKAVSYIDSNKINNKTFDEWNEIYKIARSKCIYDESTGTYRPSSKTCETSMCRALNAMGLLVLKGQTVETLNIPLKNLDDIKVLSANEDGECLIKVKYRTYETKKVTGNIDSEVTTEKDEEYKATGKGEDILDIIIKAQNFNISTNDNIEDYDEAYQTICEFMLCKGETSDSLFSGKSIDFSYDPVKVVNFNEEYNPEFQKTMTKTEKSN